MIPLKWQKNCVSTKKLSHFLRNAPGVGPFDIYSGPKDSAEDDEVEEEEYVEQDFHDEEGGKDAPGPGNFDLDRILAIISALALSVALLQVQKYKKQQMPPQRTRSTELLWKHPTQTRQAGPAQPARVTILQPLLPEPTRTQACQPSPNIILMRETVAGVEAAASDPILSGFPGVFDLLEAGDNTNPQSRIERIYTFSLGERTPLVVCLKTPEPHIRVLWVTHFVTPSFARPTPENGNILAFAQYIRLGQLPETVIFLPDWLTPRKLEVPKEAET